MSLTTVYILTFTRSQNPFDDDFNYQDTLGVWVGECIEDPELTLVVIGASTAVFLTRLTQPPSPSWISRIGHSIILWFHPEAATAH